MIFLWVYALSHDQFNGRLYRIRGNPTVVPIPHTAGEMLLGGCSLTQNLKRCVLSSTTQPTKTPSQRSQVPLIRCGTLVCIRDLDCKPSGGLDHGKPCLGVCEIRLQVCVLDCKPLPGWFCVTRKRTRFFCV